MLVVSVEERITLAELQRTPFMQVQCVCVCVVVGQCIRDRSAWSIQENGLSLCVNPWWTICVRAERARCIPAKALIVGAQGCDLSFCFKHAHAHTSTYPDLQNEVIKEEINALLKEPAPDRSVSADLMPPPARSKRPLEE
jgi:hypothetical protein